MNDISKTGYKLTVSHQRDRMLNHAKPKDVFFSA